VYHTGVGPPHPASRWVPPPSDLRHQRRLLLHMLVFEELSVSDRVNLREEAPSVSRRRSISTGVGSRERIGSLSLGEVWVPSRRA
jgi:hypothetical protein